MIPIESVHAGSRFPGSALLESLLKAANQQTVWSVQA